MTRALQPSSGTGWSSDTSTANMECTARPRTPKFCILQAWLDEQFATPPPHRILVTAGWRRCRDSLPFWDVYRSGGEPLRTVRPCKTSPDRDTSLGTQLRQFVLRERLQHVDAVVYRQGCQRPSAALDSGVLGVVSQSCSSAGTDCDVLCRSTGDQPRAAEGRCACAGRRWRPCEWRAGSTCNR
jgi:hypothetical protein